MWWSCGTIKPCPLGRARRPLRPPQFSMLWGKELAMSDNGYTTKEVVFESRGDSLLGMALLEHSTVTIQVRTDGDVVIEELG